jgi:lipoate-protein ligase A
MTETWHLIQSELGEPAFNMALDEALLVFGPVFRRPVLRLYGWARPAATFGYFQKIASIEPLTPLRPLIRRPTGGGLVPHDGDWTYSLVFPPDYRWYAWRAADSYRQLHQWLQKAWTCMGVATDLAPAAKNGLGRCFVGAEINDLLWNDRKIAGAAQRRSKQGLLIQGSLQNLPPEVAKREWQEALCGVACETLGVEWIPLEPSGALLDLAQQLAGQKYSRDEYNRRR